MTWRAIAIGALVGTMIAWMSVIETAVMALVPATWWVEIKSLHVEDSRLGEVPRMRVVRTIRRPVTGEWNKTVRRVIERGLVTVCERTGSTDFLPEALIPADIDLDWWMSDPVPCKPLAAGHYVLTTVWQLEIPGRLPKELRVVSNTFEVRE